jgi:hypothetical protein
VSEDSKNIAVRDEKLRARLLWAIAISIALHEVVAGLWPRRTAPPPEPTVVAERIKLERPRPTPRPTPHPTPRPTPHATPAAQYTLAPRVVVHAPAAKAAATPTHILGGAAAHKRIVHATPPPTKPQAPPVSLAEGEHAGMQNGGSGTGAGAGAGTGGLAGSGTGSGTTGNGDAGDTNAAPCGAVDLIPIHVSYKADGTSIQTVSATITLRDGEVQTGDFPYPFIYKSEKENPFVNEAATTRGGGALVQLPPPGTDVSKFPATVQVVLAHTDPATGTTTFPDCPPATPKSAPHP